MYLPHTERDNLVQAALRLIKAEHYALDSNPYADDEAAYAAEHFEASARELVRALDNQTAAPAVAEKPGAADQRTKFINALRDLTAFLADRPDVPIPDYPELTVDAEGNDDDQERAFVDAAARAMGVQHTADPASTHYRAEIKFGPLTYKVLAITAQAMADYREQNRLGREAFDKQHAEATA